MDQKTEQQPNKDPSPKRPRQRRKKPSPRRRMPRFWGKVKDEPAAFTTPIAICLGAVLALGGVFYTQYRTADLEDQRAQNTAELEDQRAQNDALQSYLSEMGSLLVDEDNPLSEAKVGSALSNLAQAKTRTILIRADAQRKSIVLRFLSESDLVTRVPEAKSSLLRETVDGVFERGRADILTEAQKDDNRLPVKVEGEEDKGEDRPVIGLERSNLAGVELSDGDLQGAELDQANLSGAKLARADLYGARMRAADLSGSTTDLSEADLGQATLSDADLSYADLSDAKMNHTGLTGANLTGADLSGANLKHAYLGRTTLTDADLSGAILVGAEGLTQEQIEQAIVDEETKLPLDLSLPGTEHLHLPGTWSKSSGEQIQPTAEEIAKSEPQRLVQATQDMTVANDLVRDEVELARISGVPLKNIRNTTAGGLDKAKKVNAVSFEAREGRTRLDNPPECTLAKLRMVQMRAKELGVEGASATQPDEDAIDDWVETYWVGEDKEPIREAMRRGAAELWTEKPRGQQEDTMSMTGTVYILCNFTV